MLKFYEDCDCPYDGYDYDADDYEYQQNIYIEYDPDDHETCYNNFEEDVYDIDNESCDIWHDY